MNQLVIGLGLLLFGLAVGGVGVASAGVGVGIPMIPVGLYVSYRGWRIYKYNKDLEKTDVVNPPPLRSLEQTRRGKLFLGGIIVMVGVSTSAMLVGVPIALYGVWLIYSAWRGC